MLARYYYRWRARVFLALGVIALALVVLPRIGDVIIGYTKPTTGCRVTGIVDGDTVSLKCKGQPEARARVLGYDAPEMASQCLTEWIRAQRAVWFLRSRFWIAPSVETRLMGRDKYDRHLIELSFGDTRFAPQIIAADLARAYDGGIRAGWC